LHQSYQDILDFWFAPGMDEHWYASDSKFDARIRAQFMHTYEAASDGKLDAWRVGALFSMAARPKQLCNMRPVIDRAFAWTDAVAAIRYMQEGRHWRATRALLLAYSAKGA
jgi:Bacterial protein of unknown function (DUF924)